MTKETTQTEERGILVRKKMTHKAERQMVKSVHTLLGEIEQTLNTIFLKKGSKDFCDDDYIGLEKEQKWEGLNTECYRWKQIKRSIDAMGYFDHPSDIPSSWSNEIIERIERGW